VYYDCAPRRNRASPVVERGEHQPERAQLALQGIEHQPQLLQCYGADHSRVSPTTEDDLRGPLAAVDLEEDRPDLAGDMRAVNERERLLAPGRTPMRRRTDAGTTA